MPASSPIRKLIREILPRAEAVRLDRRGVELGLTPMERRFVAHYVSSPAPDRNAREAARRAGSRNPESYAKDVVKVDRVLRYIEAFEEALAGRVVASETLEETEGAIATADQVRRHATAAMESSRMGLYVRADGSVDLEAIRNAPAGAVLEYEVLPGPDSNFKVEVPCECGKRVTVQAPARIRFKTGNHHGYVALNGRFTGIDKGRGRGRPKVPTIDNRQTLNVSLMPPELAKLVMAWMLSQQAAPPELPAAGSGA